MKKVKFPSPSSPGEIYVRKCQDCSMEYTGETGLSLQKRTQQHDMALEKKEGHNSAVAWHALKHSHSFLPPISLKRIRSLPKRRFLESLIGRVCPPSLSINAELASHADSESSSAGRLWLIDFGWVLIALAKGVRTFVERKIASFLEPKISTPQPCFTPVDSTLASIFSPLHLQAPPASVCASVSPSPDTPLPVASRSLRTVSPGDLLWVLKINPRGNVGVFAASVKTSSPLVIQFANCQIEREVPFWRIRPRLRTDPRPTPWVTRADWSHQPPPASFPPTIPPALSPPVFVDLCLDRNHSSNWASSHRPRSITSQRFVNCAHGRCKFCCQLFCSSRHLCCSYHGIRRSDFPHSSRPDEDPRSKRTRLC